MPRELTCLICLTFTIAIPAIIMGFFSLQAYNRDRRNDSFWVTSFLEQEAQARQRRFLWFCYTVIALIVILVGLVVITRIRPELACPDLYLISFC